MFGFRNKPDGKLQNLAAEASVPNLNVLVFFRAAAHTPSPARLRRHDICHVSNVMNGTGAAPAPPR